MGEIRNIALIVLLLASSAWREYLNASRTSGISTGLEIIDYLLMEK